MNYRTSCCLALSMAIGASNWVACWALDPTLAGSKIKALKIFETNAPVEIEAKSDNPEVLVTTLRNPKAQERDLKIDAVLVSKTLMELDKKLLRVKVCFKDSMSAPNAQSVTVRQGDVKAYGAGEITQATLLDSLEIAAEGRPAPHQKPLSIFTPPRTTPSTASGSTQQPPGKVSELPFIELKTDRAKQIELQGYLLNFAYALDDMQKHGKETAAYEPAFQRLQYLLKQRQYAEGITASKDLSADIRRAGGLRPLGPIMVSSPRAPGETAWGHAARLIRDDVQQVLGKDVPIRGPFLVERFRMVARMTELKQAHQNVASADSLYQKLQQQTGPGKQLAMLITMAALAADLRKHPKI